MPGAAERRLHAVCRTSFEALMLVDDQRRHISVNEPAAKLLGAPVNEIVGQPIDRFTPSEHRSRLIELWGQLQREGNVEGEYEVLRADGSRTWARFRAGSCDESDEHLIAAVEIPGPVPQPEAADSLTAREREVLQLAAAGRSAKEMAATLYISQSTVRTHLQNIYTKLGTRDRASAVATALRQGLIH